MRHVDTATCGISFLSRRRLSRQESCAPCFAQGWLDLPKEDEEIGERWVRHWFVLKTSVLNIFSEARRSPREPFFAPQPQPRPCDPSDLRDSTLAVTQTSRHA
eukprot:2417580-Pleurochrysis_carterae.AAC.1